MELICIVCCLFSTTLNAANHKRCVYVCAGCMWTCMCMRMHMCMHMHMRVHMYMYILYQLGVWVKILRDTIRSQSLRVYSNWNIKLTPRRATSIYTQDNRSVQICMSISILYPKPQWPKWPDSHDSIMGNVWTLPNAASYIQYISFQAVQFHFTVTCINLFFHKFCFEFLTTNRVN